VTFDDDNSLAVYQLSRYNVVGHRFKLTHVRASQVSTKPICAAAFAAFFGLISIGAPASAAATKTSGTHRTTVTRTSPRPKKALYSAQRSLTRRAKLARARAIATAREMADTVLPRYKIDASGELVPDVRAAAAIIYDPVTNHVLWEENSQTQRSIASITKVMTAVVFLENNPDLTQEVTIERSDVFAASTTHLKARDKVTADDLLHLLLIASDNAAARALARVSPYGSVGFVHRKNEKAAELGLENTSYADPSGLLSENVSSAYDMARLITHASGDERIGSIMRLPEYTVQAGRRTITFHSTNHLLGRENVDVLAGKTGFISKAGYCLATLLRLPQSNQQVAVVVLGARSNAGRFMETQNLFTWLSTKAATLFAPKDQQQ
jgi:D-alanyl-D-alanine endopeptidase (penicillin-binding protein 7)